eukprot:TRINITY_DN50165_c0_g1_i1.p1 TRINITY_DN50165_c0_g1~~TRINITY_DN50165_c0_g1_i1.p1  ORF type:complete len:120 (+),score=11.19 TRINITY_DN50165_c0_g1_i1:65-424(+)
MDPVLTANLTLAVACQTRKGNRSASGRRSFEHSKLREQRRKRGQLMFSDRMVADAMTKRALSQMSELRMDPCAARYLDRAIEMQKPPPDLTGPKIVTHDNRSVYDDHERKHKWAPLEYY